MSRANLKAWTGTIMSSSAVGNEPVICISTDNPDRTGDRVLHSGGDTSKYLLNPVVKYGHRDDELPVAVATAVNLGPKSYMRLRWFKGDPFAERVGNAWDQGILRAATIEFLPKASQPNEFGGLDYTQWELVGVSLVPVPANAEATRTLRSLGLWPETVDRAAFDKWLHDGPPCIDGTARKEAPVQRDSDAAISVRNILIQRAAHAPTHPAEERGALGMVLRKRPDIAEERPIPRESQGMACLSPEERRALVGARMLASGIVPFSGAARAHGPNLTGSELITFDEKDLEAALLSAKRIIPQLVRDELAKYGR